MNDSEIVFKATNNGLILIMNEELDFDSIFNQIDKKLTAAGKFFKGASLVVKYRGRKLLSDEIDRVVRLMEEKTEAEVKSFQEDTEFETAIQDRDQEIEKPINKISDLYFDGTDEGITKFYRGTVRSGQLISFNGNIVILGDVNPGAEVLASGNIIVMGWLRGTVHAGMYGNSKAIVASLNLQPVQLRISNIITRPPDDINSRGPAIPEIAYVKDDMIYIERFLPQR
ncbi:MAG TPA: septum site-determining protein MinC [Clostridiales bacterium]|nr:septum site-determining protein MinC [Clostridiales bacterium]